MNLYAVPGEQSERNIHYCWHYSCLYCDSGWSVEESLVQKGKKKNWRGEKKKWRERERKERNRERNWRNRQLYGTFKRADRFQLLHVWSMGVRVVYTQGWKTISLAYPWLICCLSSRSRWNPTLTCKVPEDCGIISSTFPWKRAEELLTQHNGNLSYRFSWLNSTDQSGGWSLHNQAYIFKH